jgi:sterol 3beta-glucosyltransferase
MEMKRHGHDVAFAFSPHFREAVRDHGVEFIPVGPDFHRVQHDIITTSVATPDIDDSAAGMYAMFAPLVASLPQMFRELSEACRNADVLISGPLQPASRVIHELTGIPFVSIQDSHFGGGGTPAYQLATTSLINPFRAQFGLPPLRYPLTHDANSPQLALYATSRHVLPPPPDWPSHYHMIGFFFFDDSLWRPDPDLVRFLDDGEPPIVITFSSMTHTDPNAVTDLLLTALEIVGRRALIQKGWSGLANRPIPPNLFATGFVPHTWLFPHASCVVHHGGAGTAAAAFRAGVPAVFVPHAADQPLWGQLACELGLTVEPIHILDLTAEKLAAAIIKVTADPRYRKANQELSEKIKAERGLSRARELIEELVNRIGLSNNIETRERQDRDVKTNRRRQYQQMQRSRKR